MTSDLPDARVFAERPQNAFSKGATFLAGDTDALPLRVFEVLITSTFVIWMTRCFLNWREWLTDQGFHLSAAELRGIGYPDPLPLPTASWQVLLLAVLILGAAAGVMLRRGRRLALLMLLACAVYLQGADFMTAVTINKIFIGVFAILLLSPGYTQSAPGAPLQVSLVAIRVLQATLILQYFGSGIAKGFNGDWLKYTDTVYTQVQGVYRTDFAAWLLRSLPVWCWTAVQGATLLFELEAPVLFCVRKLRPLALGFGIGLHLMIALMMKNLIFFSSVMWTFYALFLTADEWRALGRLALRGLMPWRQACTGHQ